MGLRDILTGFRRFVIPQTVASGGRAIDDACGRGRGKTLQGALG